MLLLDCVDSIEFCSSQLFLASVHDISVENWPPLGKLRLAKLEDLPSALFIPIAHFYLCELPTW